MTATLPDALPGAAPTPDTASAGPPADQGRARWRPGPPLVALLAGWVALFAWNGLVAQARDFLVPALLAGLLLALAGSGLRVLRPPAYVVVAVQLVLGLLSLNAVVATPESLFGVLPTPGSVERVLFLIDNGAATLNSYSSPVSVNPLSTRALLLACALAVLFAVDVLGMTLRRTPLVALPLLVTLAVPVSILTDPLSLPVFVGTSLLFLRLLATEHLDRFGTWGGRRRTSRSVASTPMLSVLWQVAVVAVLGALLIAPLVPVTNLLHHEGGGTGGGGTGTGGLQLTGINPFIHLRRDLVAQTHTPLVYAETKAASTSYLRTTVLDEFTSDDWRPSPRNLPSENDADGTFPDPPGLAPGIGGAEDQWALQFAPNFSTTWLPLPYPIRNLQIPGSWRFDTRTLDVAYVGGGSDGIPGRVSYTATAFTPTITADMLDTTVKAPAKLRKVMTAVPDDLPEVITTRAKEVTRGAKTDFAKAVALQDWFRTGGGFEYSLDQRGGSGMDLLASFVTNDRVGYCEQFAAAMAAMGRSLGIPSRVVVGFLNGDEQSDGRILYTSDDRHAWPEMYFTGVGWVRFEPTPAERTGATPSYTRQSAQAAAPSAAPSAAASTSAAPAPAPAATDTTTSTDTGVSVPWWPVLAVVLLLVLAIAPGLVRRLQRRRRLSAHDPAGLAEGAWAELQATAQDLGLDWPQERSPREQARRVTEQVTAPGPEVDSLQGLLLRVERGRYAPRGGDQAVSSDERARTVATVQAWRRAMIDQVARVRGWRGRVWPVSLLR